MLVSVAGSPGTRNCPCNYLDLQGLERRDFRAEFSAASLKPEEAARQREASAERCSTNSGLRSSRIVIIRASLLHFVFLTAWSRTLQAHGNRPLFISGSSQAKVASPFSRQGQLAKRWGGTSVLRSGWYQLSHITQDA